MLASLITLMGVIAFLAVGIGVFLIVVGIAIHVGMSLVETIRHLRSPAPQYHEDYSPQVHPIVERFVKIGAGTLILGTMMVFLTLWLGCAFPKR